MMFETVLWSPMWRLHRIFLTLPEVVVAADVIVDPTFCSAHPVHLRGAVHGTSPILWGLGRIEKDRLGRRVLPRRYAHDHRSCG